MKPREYKLMQECVEAGVSYGLRRAHKHTDDPTEQQIEAAIVDAVMNEIAESWNFDDDPAG